MNSLKLVTPSPMRASISLRLASVTSPMIMWNP